MKFLLTSNGVNNIKIANELERLSGKSLVECTIVFVITAGINMGDDKSWLIDNLIDIKNLNFKRLDIVDVADDNSNWKDRLHEADIICVGGGNEIYLEEVFEKINMKNFLLHGCDQGKVYLGISAGSMAAGINLDDTSYQKLFMSVEDYGFPTVDGMQLFDFCFIPHMDSEYFKFTKETLESMKDTFKNNVYAVDDNTAISIDGENIKIIGDGESFVSI